jgi:hypothetical protein
MVGCYFRLLFVSIFWTDEGVYEMFPFTMSASEFKAVTRQLEEVLAELKRATSTSLRALS